MARAARPKLAVRAQVSVRQIEQIEQAIRRTRRSTLDRIAIALVELAPHLGAANALAERLAELAGPRPSARVTAYRERVEKRRKARWGRLERRLLVPGRSCRGCGLRSKGGGVERGVARAGLIPPDSRNSDYFAIRDLVSLRANARTPLRPTSRGAVPSSVIPLRRGRERRSTAPSRVSTRGVRRCNCNGRAPECRETQRCCALAPVSLDPATGAERVRPLLRARVPMSCRADGDPSYNKRLREPSIARPKPTSSEVLGSGTNRMVSR